MKHPVVGRTAGMYPGVNAFRSHPVMGSKLYCCWQTHHRKAGGQKFLNVRVRVQTLRESQVVGPKA